jgi:uncharacterized membrane protein
MAKRYKQLDVLLKMLEFWCLLTLRALIIIGLAVPIGYFAMTHNGGRNTTIGLGMCVIGLVLCTLAVLSWVLIQANIQLVHAIKDTAINTEATAQHASSIAEQLRTHTEAID